MSANSRSQLRLHTESADQEAAVESTELASLCEAFERATGWELRYETTSTGFGEAWSTPIETAGRLVLAAATPPSSERTEKQGLGRREACPTNVRPLALAIAGQLNEINRLRRAVWEREAELAAGVPVARRKDEEPHLAERLEAVLKAGAEGVGCQAAGLYLIDDATSVLKLRAMWNLPEERLLAPARPLRGAMADLEALVGHAVVLEDTSLVPHWRCPEDFPAAACVPVSSPSIPLGTLWVFSSEKRDFSAEQTNLLEIIAGRLAADLEREMLLAAGTKSKRRNEQISLAGQWQRERLPSVKPLIDDYEIAGWTLQADEIGGDFHDWSVLPDGRLAVLIGSAEGRLIEAAMNAAWLQTSLKAHSIYPHSAGKLLTRVNECVAASSPGGQQASAVYAAIEPQTGAIELSIAGSCAALILGSNCQETLLTDSPPLGGPADTEYEEEKTRIGPGESLVLISSGVLKAVDAMGKRIGDAAITRFVASNLTSSAENLAARLRNWLLNEGQVAADMSVVVVKRRA